MALNPTPLAESSTFPAAINGPLANSTVQSADVDNGLEKLGNRTRYLADTKVNRAGDTMTGPLVLNAGGTVTSGQTLNLGGVTLSGAVIFDGGNVIFAGSPYIAVMSFGRKTLNRARVTLSDGNHTVSVDAGDRFSLPPNEAAPRTITLDDTVVVPVRGETITFFWNPGSATPGNRYTFRRADATVIATFVGGQIAYTGAVFAEFEYVLISSGPDVRAWRLGANSGTPNEYTGPVPGPESWDRYGVVPGAGA
jgi:hypothetical protein